MKIRRTVGTRTHRPRGMRAGPTPAEYEWSRQMARYRTRVPKGVFRYVSMDEVNADWERWHAELVAEVAPQERHRSDELVVRPEAVGYTRPATWDDVIALARLLNAHGARYIVVGGYALAAHGYVRMTEAIDIAVAPEPENARRWTAALAQLPDGASRELQYEDDPFQGDHLHAIRINDEVTVDVLPAVAGVPVSELERHLAWLDLQGERVPVLDLEGLLDTKQGARPKDQADARLLRKAIAVRKRDEGGQVGCMT